jgi:hypothetical protein
MKEQSYERVTRLAEITNEDQELYGAERRPLNNAQKKGGWHGGKEYPYQRSPQGGNNGYPDAVGSYKPAVGGFKTGLE